MVFTMQNNHLENNSSKKTKQTRNNSLREEQWQILSASSVQKWEGRVCSKAFLDGVVSGLGWPMRQEEVCFEKCFLEVFFLLFRFIWRDKILYPAGEDIVVGKNTAKQKTEGRLGETMRFRTFGLGAPQMLASSSKAFWERWRWVNEVTGAKTETLVSFQTS